MDEGAWRVSDGEALAELRADRDAIAAGDFSSVAPWSTPAQALAEIDVQIAALVDPITDGSEWIASWAKGRADVFVWTVRGVTSHGVYFTCPESRSPGHLLSQADFRRQYVRRPAGSSTEEDHA